MSDKIQPHHLDRKAILYVRQSSTHQVMHNQESRLLQYAMRDRLGALGWREIEVVDDDLGRSAAGSAIRAGFERMVAEVCLGKVGAVAAREVSRFARNSRDWQQLIEMCRVVDTLLVDQETIYAPRQGNDRLLLGLKGSLNEYELDLLRQRSLAARHEKARRGELIVMAPVGYLKTDDQRLEKDPDQRVQEAISKMLASNLSGANQAGAAKRGASLLAGLMRCRRCGRKMMVYYTGQNHDTPRYACFRGRLDSGEPPCISFGGIGVDDAIEDELLRVLEPGAIDAALEADRQKTQRDDEVLEALKRDLEAARYTADKAFRQYDAADPANRLVAGELEVRWNRALERVAELQTRIEKHIAETPAATPACAADFSSLAADLKVIWRDPTTDVTLRKRIVRELIHEVIADVDATGGEIILVVHWAGGVHAELRVLRRRRGQRKRTALEIVEAVRMLARKCTDDVIAGILTRNDLRTGNGNRWTRERVTSLRNSHEIPVYRSDTCEAEGWMNLTQAAALLGISPKTLRIAAEQGEIEATHPLAEGPWLFKRAILEREETNCLVERVRRRRSHPTGLKYRQPNLFESMT